MKIKRKIVCIATTIAISMSFSISKFAQTVGTAISWNYGRSMDVTSYSNFATSKFVHSSTANSRFSGWQ